MLDELFASAFGGGDEDEKKDSGNIDDYKDGLKGISPLLSEPSEANERGLEDKAKMDAEKESEEVDDDNDEK